MQFSRILRVSASILAGVFILIAGSFGMARLAAAGEVLGSVTVLGTQVGGMTEAEMVVALTELDDQLATTPVDFVVDGNPVTLDPRQIGFAIPIPEVASEAMRLGRTGDIPNQFRWWMAKLGQTVELPIESTFDVASMESVLALWDVDVVGDPPFEGAVLVEGTSPVAQYPRAGRRIDRSNAPALIAAAIADDSGQAVALPVLESFPTLTPAAIDNAVATARLWLSAPITLNAANRNASIVFSPADLATALRSEPQNGSMRLYFDVDEVGRTLDASRSDLELPPIDAALEVTGNEVRIVPGKVGTLIDAEQTAAALEAVAGTSVRVGVLPFQEGAEPAITTESLEALGIKHLISQFTTYHDCCQNRVTNIHLFADAVTRAIVPAGKTFELNDHVGERTVERGFLEDGTIVQGELVRTVGGGVSQFATTFYNAVFWGGLEDISHRPHSFYFSRYPEGIEATISWPLPRLEFRNDYPTALLIVTEYTDTSITVKFFGDNDGRIVIGEQRGGRTELTVVAEGGANARVVSSSVSGRFSPTEPRTEIRAAEEPIEVDEQRVVQKPAAGWSVKVTRTIVQNGAEKIDEWTVRYLAKREIIEVHPCMVPDSEITCPTTTTTSSTTIPTTTSQP